MASADRWLTAHEDKLAGIYTFSSCITLADLTGDGDTNLIVGDLGAGSFNMKLRVYKGTQMISENTIIDLPTGVVSFHMDNTEPRLPAIAVASGPHIYVYKNMKPYFKFTLPSLEIHLKEQELWNLATEVGDREISRIYESFRELRSQVGDATIATRTQRLLMLSDQDQIKAFIELHRGFPLKRQTVITCIAVLKRSHADEYAASCLILGTEANSIYILDPEAFTILDVMSLSSPPALIAVSGLYDVDFRIVTACRDGSLCALKRGWKHAKVIAILNSQAVGLIRREKTIIVATMDEKLCGYSSKGKLLWSVKLPHAVLTLCPMEIPERGAFFIAVALNDNKVYIYNDKHAVDCISLNDSVSSILFGRFGREDSALVLITVGGALIIKILKRTSQFDKIENMSSKTSSDLSTHQLSIPKKTKLFVEQTHREREHAVLMHRIFQHDLYRLRLRTASTFVESMETGDNPISVSTNEPIKMSAQVLGLGPVFKLIIGLTNVSVDKPSRNLMIVFYNDDKIYSLSKDVIQVPMLVPGLEYSFETLVECVSDTGLADEIRIFVVGSKSSKPILAAVINMPVAEVV